MKLITELNYEPMSLLTEADASGEKHLYIKGPMAVSEVKNKNGRIYKKALLEKVIDKYTRDFINTGRALGELNHPNRMSVDYERATHLVTEMVQDGNIWIGKARILKTPMGQIIEGLCRSGVNIGMSTRGAGSLVESNGAKYVGDDFVMGAIDAVSDPSGQYQTKDGSLVGCFVNGVMEGVEFFQTDDGKWYEQIMAEEAKKAYDKKILNEAKMLELFNSFMGNLKNGIV